MQLVSQVGFQCLNKLDNNNQYQGGGEGGKGVEMLIVVGDCQVVNFVVVYCFCYGGCIKQVDGCCGKGQNQ